MIKILHCSDIHIHNTRYHAEYKQVFNKICEIAKKEKIDFIVNTGDTAHTKVNLSPEYFDLAYDIFSSLAEIAPVYSILGNHDGNLKSSSRLDAVSPVIKNIKNTFLLKNSGEYPLTDKIVLNVLSIFDKDNWIITPSDPTKINIALYHGTISGCRTDLGFQFQHGENDLNIFKNFDFALLGDIHKTNQILDNEGRIRYAGSTIQQNHGETNDKGVLIWEIEDKDDFDVIHYPIPNPKPFISLTLTEKGKVPEADIPIGARLRLIAETPLTYPIIQKALQVAKIRYRPESITSLNNSTDSSRRDNIIFEGYKKEDLRDIVVQEKLIKEYLKDFNVSEEVLIEVLNLNKEYETKISLPRNNNISFEVIELEWSNLFKYGAKNKIDFNSLHGITSIFGKNFIGKSSIIDILCFAIFGDITKKKRKFINILNNNRDYGFCSVTLKIADRTFTIKRTLERKIAKRLNKDLGDAKSTVDFVERTNSKYEELNGTTIHETNRNIEKYFGSLDDFLLTGLASQKEPFKFIDERSTKRKEILGKFIGINFLNEKYELANEDAKAHKGLVKKYNNTDFDDQILKTKKEYKENLILLLDKKNQCDSLKEESEKLEVIISDLQTKLASIPAEYKEVNKIENQLNYEKSSLKGAQTQNSNLLVKINKTKSDIESDKKENDKINIIFLKEQERKLEEYFQAFEECKSKREQNEKELLRLLKKGQLLNEVPCGDQFPNCSFIKDAHKAREKIDIIREVLKTNQEDLEIKEKQWRNFLDSLNNKNPNYDIKAYENRRNNIKYNEQMLKAFEAEQKAFEGIIQNHQTNISRLERDLEENKKHVDSVENRLKYKNELDSSKLALEQKKKQIKICDTESLRISKQNGVLEHKIQTLEEQRKEKLEVETRYQAYELYTKCVHPNGIPFNIIKNVLPAINAELSEILSDIVDFKIFFVHEDNRLDVFLQREEDTNPTLLELGSGAESTLSGMAIRLALIRISSIPLGDLFILDEPSFLDADNLEGLTRVMTVIKTIFKSVIMITHLESLKDIVDSSIEISQKDGFSYIS